MSDWEQTTERRRAVEAIEGLRKTFVTENTDSELASTLNTRAVLALDGYQAQPQVSLIELLVSGVEISTEVRERIAEALAGTNANHPRLLFAGGVGPKSAGGLIDQRRAWLALADDFLASELSQPAYLKSGRMGIDQRQRKLLQDAIAFHRMMLTWAGKEPRELSEYFDLADASEKDFLTRAVFCCFVVGKGLTDMKSLRDFLQEG
ncbi:hypothetical protein I5L01_09300 [Erythrobacter sp. YJ-T3-07]|nr:hypothetical protein [Erythrobacter sp. YJ-T3-07]